MGCTHAIFYFERNLDEGYHVLFCLFAFFFKRIFDVIDNVTDTLAWNRVEVFQVSSNVKD